MIDTKILLSIVIVILIGAAAAGYQITAKNTAGLWQPITSQNPTINEQSSPYNSGTSSGDQTGSQAGGTGASSGQGQGTDTGGVTVNIQSSDAKIIAQKYIEEPGATAGTPELKSVAGKQTYVVPVIKNGEVVGEIYIDPETGENTGGAGGAPNG